MISRIPASASDVQIDGSNLDIDMGGICGEAIIDVTTGHINIEAWQGMWKLTAQAAKSSVSLPGPGKYRYQQW